MAKHRRRWSVIAAVMFFSVVVAGASALHAARIFILHSYEQGHVCGQPQHDGVVSVLRQAGYNEYENLVLDMYFMDTKQHNNTRELIARQAELARNRIEAFNPDVLVTLDDNAFSSVGLTYVDGLFPVVFSGVNRRLEQYNALKPFMNSRRVPGHNITGVFEKLHVKEALRVHSRLFPGVGTVEFVVDRSVTGEAMSEQIREELASGPLPCSWRLAVVDSWEAYQKEIRRANRDSAIGAIYPAAQLLKDKKGNVYTALQIIPWTAQVSTKPELAINCMFTRLGVFGGAAVDFYAMGRQTGRMVTRILQGEDTAGIAIEDADRYALTFNLHRAAVLGLDIPQDVILSADEIVKD